MPDNDGFFDIDPELLDKQWCEHPRFYHRQAVELADARRELERAKADKEVTEDEAKETDARVSLAIRKAPGSLGIEKVTEDVIKAAVLVHPDHKRALKRCYDARERVIAAQHAADVCEAAVHALRHKKDGLQDMVQLRLSDYFSAPRAPQNAREAMGKAERDAAFDRRGKR